MSHPGLLGGFDHFLRLSFHAWPSRWSSPELRELFLMLRNPLLKGTDSLLGGTTEIRRLRYHPLCIANMVRRLHRPLRHLLRIAIDVLTEGLGSVATLRKVGKVADAADHVRDAEKVAERAVEAADHVRDVQDRAVRARPHD